MIFKENWEKTQEKVHISQDLILKMLQAYYPKSDIKNISKVEGGCANINVLVELNNSNKLVVLRIYLRDKNSAYKEKKISEILCGKIPIPEIYHITEKFGYTFAIVKYLEGTSLREILLSNRRADIGKIMLKVGETLGAISRVKFKVSGFFDKNFEINESIEKGSIYHFCCRILEEENVKAILPLEKIKEIKNLFYEYETLLPDNSEKNLVHGDFDPSNILVKEINGQLEISGIMDWEFAFSGSTLFDVANMLRYSHKCPKTYSESFIKGLTKYYKLPDSWKITMYLLNILSLLECLSRSKLQNVPNQTKDIKELINYMLCSLRNIQVVPYNSKWPLTFKEEAKKIRHALSDSIINIYHVGSTSVPGLAAKPKIDIIAEVKSLSFNYKNLLSLNYKYRGGFNLPFRRSFTLRSDKLNVNLHIFEKEDPEIALNLIFRNYLRRNSDIRDEYASLKYKLLEDDFSHKKEGSILKGYTLGKNALIQDILKKSGFNQLRLVICTHYNEWKAAKAFREKYFLDLYGKNDPDTWTYHHQDHKHFILYQGIDVVGYAHIEVDKKSRAIIKIITTDKKYKSENYREKFIELIKKWRKLEGYKNI